VRILHCHSTFDLGGKEARTVRLMNAFGDAARHTVLTADPNATGARAAIDPGIAVNFPIDAPSLNGKPGLGRYWHLSRYMRRFDLVLTYNWGAMDAVGARRLNPAGCPPLIHHEDGFNEDEAGGLDWKRNGFRRFMLPTVRALIVPSRTLEIIAREVWKQGSRLHRIPNGIDTARYAPPVDGAIPGFERQPGEVVIGTLAGLRAVKNLPRLVRAFAPTADRARLVIVGEGPERGAILAEADRLGVANRVLLSGFLPDPHRYLGLFDIFALSSDSEQFPISVVEAMAAGLPLVATDVGDVSAMVPEPQRAFIVARTDEQLLSSALTGLVNAAALRASLGKANAVHARSQFDEAAMIASYASLYGLG
jgi:L-malate glycosyltransferase